jgi:hypothetical protein
MTGQQPLVVVAATPKQTGRPEGRPVAAARGESLSGFPHRRNLFPRVPKNLRGSFRRRLSQATANSADPTRPVVGRAALAVRADNEVHLVPPYVGNPDAAKYTRRVAA